TWRRMLSMRRSDLAYRAGRWPEAARHARAAGHTFYTEFAARIEQTPSETRQRGGVPAAFVRQNHLTCGPAALAALVRHFASTTQQAEIVDQIWYGGTFDFRERAWAEREGWTVHEFTVTWEAARALLDASIPFGVATRETTSGHLQIVMGYDATQ